MSPSTPRSPAASDDLPVRRIDRVLAFMRDGQWHSLQVISEATGDPEASVSARLRDLRKPRFGAFLIERRYVERGLFEYRLKVGQLKLLD